ncbi:1541_t:CDS:2 [Diversispora eburnea]|uniref:1541_t:CDS:1 n=1 Tax=Diversispora eburnea TaxID=1213867 RepID=A0A9N8ZIP4_9GLOM|nr:1541_t:CDS:2 [Diversispora eburnea]
MSKKDKKKIIDGESDEIHFTGDYAIATSIFIEPFVPLFDTFDKVLQNLYTIYENAKCNKKMCGALIDRIEVLEQTIESLKRKKQENAAKFSKKEYYRAWVRFTNVLKNIKNFAKDVTQQLVFQKYLNAIVVKEAYDKNIKEFEGACGVLQFSVYIVSEEQRKVENEKILNELNLLEWAMRSVSDEMKYISKQINILSKRSSLQKLNSDEIEVPYVKSSELTYPETNPGNVRGSERTIVKRIHRETLQVACKKVQAIGKNLAAGSRNIQTQLAILDLLGKCSNIITFYGLSKIDKIDYMVFEWAEHGSLKEVYEKSSIPLPTNGVLHHDVRCESILVTENPVFDVRISNFEIIRKIKVETVSFSGLNDYVRCFGMLIWELINEKIPYKDMSFDEVQEHVKSKKRENLPRLNSDPILLGLTKLIKQTWDNEPLLRPSYPETLKLISNLERSVQLNSPLIYPLNDSNDDEPAPTFSLIKPFEDGIKAHREKRYKEAWECFNDHANLGLSLAKYWKGYYLTKGFHVEKDIKEGLELLKSAADDGIPDAQLRYANGLINLNISNGSSENYEIILKYMEKAADGGSEIALYNLSVIYLRGKFGVEKDEKKGNEYFELAALKNPKFKKPTQ